MRWINDLVFGVLRGADCGGEAEDDIREYYNEKEKCDFDDVNL